MCRSPSFQSVLTCRPGLLWHGQSMVGPPVSPRVSPQWSWLVHDQSPDSPPDMHLCYAEMALKCLLAGSPCRRGPIAPFIDRLGIGSVRVCHAGMALEYLWAGLLCRRPVRRPLSHAITCIRWVSPDSHVRGNTRLSESSAVRCHRSS